MQTYLLHTDLRGSTRVACDVDGATAAWFGCDPFGVTLESQRGGDTRIADRLTRRYTGQVSEQESGLYHYGARLCDTALARFVSVDPAHQTPSPYAYCANDPVDHIDPDGRDPRRVIYYQGWFLVLDETDSVYALVGQSHEYLLDTQRRICIYDRTRGESHYLRDLFPYNESLWTAFDLPIEEARVQIPAVLRSLAESGETMPVSARVRLENIINRAIRNSSTTVRSVHLRRQFMFQRSVGSQSYRTQSTIDKKKLASTQEYITGTGLNEVLTLHANTIDANATARNLFMRLAKPAPFYSRQQLKVARTIEGSDPETSSFVSPEMQRELLLPLGAYLLGPHSPLSDGLNNAIRNLLLGVVQPPSNTTTITSSTAHELDDDATESLSGSSTESSIESHEPPAKPGGEKPYMPSSDEDTESL